VRGKKIKVFTLDFRLPSWSR